MLLTIFLYIPPHQGEAGGLKFHVIFLELIYCCVSSAVKFEALSMRMEVGVALLLKNPVNPFMHADVHALYEGTNSTQIS